MPMIDKTPRADTPRTLPEFTPVPRKCERYDGWTPERQRGFIEALADTGSVKAAAHAVNMTPEGAYILRRHPQGESFRKAWEAALALGVQRLEDVAMERALHGVEVPIYCYGKVIGTRRVYNDALLMFLLRNRAPQRFAADSLNNPDAATRTSLERLKRNWREEWEAERQAEDAGNLNVVRASIQTKLTRLRETVEHRRAEAMSPETSKLREAYEAGRRADDQRRGNRPALPGPEADSKQD